MQWMEHIPDSAKVTLAVAPTTVTLMGVPVEQWTFILSGVVAVLVIIEKLPKAYQVIKGVIKKCIQRING